ncbi:LytR/AlgR family response regulator transcription factor [Loigolactobacillus jiayinensis]|uniref:LytR/AlgR family response regulator transcription factor n=1 Tax=Loigolactobacillus jiayinensis TaxID=2486016 RepID=A0ABW1RFN5_9LACO
MCGDLYYLTNYPNFVFDSFNTHPENYILKPLTIDNLCRILLKAVRNISEKKNKKFIECRSVNSIDSINIQINKIVYIELISSPKRIIKIVTSKNLFLIHGRLNHYAKILEKYKFVQVYRSFIVNLNYIHHFSSNKIIPRVL